MPSFNVNIQGVPRSGNRVFMKGSKGSASLTRPDNNNQTATCYSCGVLIRYTFHKDFIIKYFILSNLIN